jgi:hypothetical protein
MNHPLKDRLGNKPILLMDDEYYTVGDYQLRLNDIGVGSEHAETLDRALEMILTAPDKYGLALLDLKMPSAKNSTLQSVAGELQLTPTSMNHGRCLGLHLWKQRATLKLRYCYISSVPQLYGQHHGEFDGQNADFILNKSIPHSQLASRLVEVLQKWDALSGTNGSAQAGGQP